MIASIQGQVLQIGEDNLVVEVGGVGFLVFVTESQARTRRHGEGVSLFTHLVVREDSLTLFGFQDQEELSLFRELIKVNGVGPRLALETLSTHTPDIIKKAVVNKQEVTTCRHNIDPVVINSNNVWFTTHYRSGNGSNAGTGSGLCGNKAGIVFAGSCLLLDYS